MECPGHEAVYVKTCYIYIFLHMFQNDLTKNKVKIITSLSVDIASNKPKKSCKKVYLRVQKGFSIPGVAGHEEISVEQSN